MWQYKHRYRDPIRRRSDYIIGFVTSAIGPKQIQETHTAGDTAYSTGTQYTR